VEIFMPAAPPSLKAQAAPGPQQQPCPTTGKRQKKKPAQLAKPSEPLPFWKIKSLETLSSSEWESLCDGCGRCCLVKLEDEDSGQIYYTDLACRLFDPENCRCTDYARRARRVRDCLKLTPAKVKSLQWLPPSCAYRLVAAGKDLPWWHPLVSGSTQTVHEAGVSTRGRVGGTEEKVKLTNYPDHIVTWPGRFPRTTRPKHKAGKAGAA